MLKLRLIVTQDCPRKCVGCCNDDWDLDNLPVERDFSPYDLIMLTGGEPLILDYLYLAKIVNTIRVQTKSPIYLYTAYLTCVALKDKLRLFDGVTVTLHTQQDAVDFYNNRYSLPDSGSRRLNVFKGVRYGGLNTEGWVVKDNIVRIKNSPLPEGEVLKRHKEKSVSS